MNRATFGRAVIVAGCVYEVAAIGTGRAPTITMIVQTIGRQRWSRFVMWLWLGFVVDHFVDS